MPRKAPPRKQLDAVQWAKHPRAPWSPEYRDRVRRAAYVYLFARGYGDWAFKPGGLQDEIVRDEESGLKTYLTQKEIDSLQPNARKRAAFMDGPRGTGAELKRLRRMQDLVTQQIEAAHRQGNTQALESLQFKERDLQERVDRLAFPEEHKPNGGYYVWVVKPNGVPLTSEGPYGPHPLTEAKQLARIGATNGEHDRAVTLGRDPGSDSFKIVRLYRRRTGERVL